MRDARHHDRHNGESYRQLEPSTGSKRRRARSAREKAAIVAETFAPGTHISKIARRHRLNRGVLFTWRQPARSLDAGTFTADTHCQSPACFIRIDPSPSGEARTCEVA